MIVPWCGCWGWVSATWIARVSLQAQLFDEDDRDKHARIDEVGDLVRERFGMDALCRGSTLGHEGGADRNRVADGGQR